MRSQDWRRFQSMVQAALGEKVTHRYRTTAVAITQNATTPIQLLKSDDDPDFDTGGDFATPCECEQGSRITGIDINFTVVPINVGDNIEWMLWKNPDEALSAAAVAPSVLFTNDVSSTTLLIRKYALAYGMFKSTTSREAKSTHVRISRAAMRRAGLMRDNDMLYLTFQQTGSASNATFAAYGRIWTRK